MTKLDSLRRIFLSCFTSTSATNHRTTTTKTRLSTSLRDDITSISSSTSHQDQDQDSDSSPLITSTTNPPRPSKTMLIGTLFGHRRGQVWFAVQHHRQNPKPSLLLQLSIQTQTLVQQIQFGLVRLALETHTPPDSDLRSCPLRSIPTWTLYCNGRKLGFAARKKATEPIRVMLKAIQSTTVGAGVIPAFAFDGGDGGELIYMRANYECIVGGPDSESFHLVNPDGCLGNGQDLSIFLMRTRGPSF